MKNKSIHLPAPLELDNFKYNNSLNSLNVLFVGAMFMPNNLEAVEWYLNNVHSSIVEKYPNYVLTVAGNSGKYSEAFFKDKFSSYSNVELLFDLDSLDEVYNKSSVFINPMQHGAGVKIKSIHSIMNGLPLVATKVGSEGIGLVDGKTFILGETASEFANGVIKLLEGNDLRKEIASKGQEFLIENDASKILKIELEKIL